MRPNRLAIAPLAALAVACGLTTAAAAPASVASRTPACGPQILRGVLPAWARAGFSDARPRMPHVLSADGRLTAILWADPLRSPAPLDHNNKILWVSRVAAHPDSDLRISAQRMVGTRAVGAPVARRVPGGPGPSIINLPAAGCWRLSLHWWGQADTIDLRYAPRS